MGVKVIDDGKLYLCENWGGPVCMVPPPSDLTTIYATGAAIPCPVGTKIAIYQATNNGYAYFMLLQYEKGTATAAAIKTLCAPDTTEAAAAGGGYIVTNDASEVFLKGGRVAVALNTLTDGDRAWFWVGGVCPVDSVAGLDGNFPATGAITAGNPMTIADNGDVVKFSAIAANVTTGTGIIPVGVTYEAVTTS
jgi:hypothetical protein